MLFRDFHQLSVDTTEGQPLPFLKKDTLNFLGDNKGATLKAKINATYSGYLLNRRVYPGRYLKQHDCYGDFCSEANGGTASYDKPVLCHHDHHGEPIGRVVNSNFMQLLDGEAFMDDFKNPATEYQEGSGLIQVVALITDAEAIEKILDGRYNTVSTGQGSDHLWCSICGKDWKSEDFCEHLPGRVYSDEETERKMRCYGITGKLKYHELSYVNIPANSNAVTVATEMSDSWEGDKADFVDHDKALSYGALCLVDSAGNEVDLSNKEGEDLPATKTQVQVSSEIDLDKLNKPAEVDMSDHGPYLSDEVFAIGNTLRSMTTGEMLEDAPMSHMYSYFKAIAKKAGGHQHILYLEFDLGKKRIQGGTEFTDKGEHHYHSIDLPVEDLNAKTFKGETRDANQGDHHVHSFEFDMMEDHLEQVSLVDAMECARMVDKALREKKLSRSQQIAIICDEEELEFIDAKLTAAKRKKLKDSTFCGPSRSFPVPDCAHVTAARRLIGRAKLSADSKAKVLSCVSRKAKAMGCDKSKDETTADPYGMIPKHDEETPMSEKKTETPAPEAKAPEQVLRDGFEALKDGALLDKAVELAQDVESKDKSIVKLTGEKDALVEKNESVEAASKALADSNTDLREKLHLAKARELAIMRLVSGGLVVDSDEKFEEAVKELAERTEDSLADAIKDSMGAFQKALAENTPDPSAFLKDKGQEKDPVEKNGDQTNDEEARKALEDEKEKAKTPEARKDEAAKTL
jgi:hypothetical protein